MLGLQGNEKVIKSKIRETIVNKVRSFNSADEIETYDIAKNITEVLPTINSNALDGIIMILKPFLKLYKDNYNELSKSTIPAIVYSGDEDSLPVIFDRINSQGTPLNQYEVYAASWPLDKKFEIKNSKIIEKILRKYDSLADDEYLIYGYSRDELRLSQKVTAFEYLFGLSKYLNEEVPFLLDKKNEKADEINTLAFELVNACLNESRDGIKTLYNNILNLDVKLFEERIFEAIKFVGKIIAPVTSFKGNKRKEKTSLYSKFQVLSMIAYTFREKYDMNDLTASRKTWAENKSILEKNMLQRFVYDIITNGWSEGGTSKIYSVLKTNYYMAEIPKAAWDNALNSIFENENMRNEKAQVSSVSNADYVILNCIHLSTFTAMDQLSLEKYDIEHIAPKEQMKEIIKLCNQEGLPISNIANLCYLPEFVNRSKGAKNFYQDSKYLNKVKLEDVENKFSFTKREDLEWMDMPYKDGDYDNLKEFYMEFLKKRFDLQMKKFYLSMKIT